MKTSQIIAAAALTILAATGAQAETYQGVNTAVSTKSRDDVNAEAVRAASAPNQNVTRGSRGPDPFTSSRDPAQVYQEAMATAAAPDQNVTGGSRVNSKVISTMENPVLKAAQGK